MKTYYIIPTELYKGECKVEVKTPTTPTHATHTYKHHKPSNEQPANKLDAKSSNLLNAPITPDIGLRLYNHVQSQYQNSNINTINEVGKNGDLISSLNSYIESLPTSLIKTGRALVKFILDNNILTLHEGGFVSEKNSLTKIHLMELLRAMLVSSRRITKDVALFIEKILDKIPNIFKKNRFLIDINPKERFWDTYEEL